MPSGSLPSTLDALLGGRVAYEQPARGYRVALEAPMLARFAIEGRTRPFTHAVDLGAGPGAIGLMLVFTGWATRATAIEIDADHARLARANADRNGVADRLAVVESDVGQAEAQPGDVVIANPPYFEPDEGAVAPDATRAGARAFTRGTLQAFVRASRRLLGPRGRVVVALPAARTTELLGELAERGLHAKRLRFVHPRPGREAQVVFVEAKAARPGGLVVEPPWYVRGVGDDYVDETDAALRGRWPEPARR